MSERASGARLRRGARRVRPPRRIPARGARRGGRGGRRAPRCGAGPGRRHGRRAGDDRPAGVQGPRPGRRRRPARLRGRRRLPRALRHRRPRCRRGAGRGAGHRGAPARADGVPARRLGAAAPARALRGRREPAARRPACGRAVADRPRRRGRAGVGRGTSGGGPVAGPPRLRGRAGLRRRRERSIPRSRRSRRSGRCAAPWPCAAGRSSWSCPSRRSCARTGTGGWTVRVRQRPPVEDWNAEISLLTGTTAARIMLDAGIGVLRTLPAAGPEAVTALRAVARGLGIALARGADPGRAAVRAAARHPRRAGSAPGRHVAAAGRRLHRVRHAPPVRRRPPTPATPGSARRTRTSRRRCGGSSTGSARRCASP